MSLIDEIGMTTATFGLQTWMGIPIHKAVYVEDAARFKLSPEVPVTPAFRAGFDRWAREFFGTVPTILRGTDPLTGNTVFFASPAAYAALQEQAA